MDARLRTLIQKEENNMWKTVLFDLDGTLTDSADGITKCVRYALEQMGMNAPDPSELNCFVGPPLHEMFMKYAKMDEAMADQAVELYRERYTQVGMYENHLYPYITKLLALFKKNGITMGVASSKPEVYVKQILKHFGIDHYFKVVVGSELDGTRVKKKEVLEEAIHRLRMDKKKDQIVLVGDTAFDVLGAHEVGIACIGVSYGYGEKEDLEVAQPIYVAETVSDVAECVMSSQNNTKKESAIFQVWRIVYPILIHLGITCFVMTGWYLVYTTYELVVLKNHNMQAIQEVILQQNIYQVLLISLVSIAIYPWIFRGDEWYRKELGIRSRMMTADKFGIMRMILVVVFFVLLGTFLNQLITWSEIDVLFDGYNQIAETLFSRKIMLVSLVTTSLFAPIAEEYVFRALVYRRIRDYINIKWAIIISSLLFGLYHGNVVQCIYGTLMGIALAAVYERYKTLWAPILAHIAANAFASIMEFKGYSLVPESTSRMFVVLCAEIMVLSVLGAYMLHKWTPQKREEFDDNVLDDGVKERDESDITQKESEEVYESSTEVVYEEPEQLEKVSEEVFEHREEMIEDTRKEEKTAEDTIKDMEEILDAESFEKETWEV